MIYKLATITCALGGVPSPKGIAVTAEIWTLTFCAVPDLSNPQSPCGTLVIQTSDQSVVDKYKLGADYKVTL